MLLCITIIIHHSYMHERDTTIAALAKLRTAQHDLELRSREKYQTYADLCERAKKLAGLGALPEAEWPYFKNFLTFEKDAYEATAVVGNVQARAYIAAASNLVRVPPDQESWIL
jgi:hypothetical protein